MKKKSVISVRVPSEVKEKVVRMARKNGMSMGKFVHLGLCSQLRALESDKSGAEKSKRGG